MTMTWKRFLGLLALLFVFLGAAIAAPKDAVVFAGATPAWADLDRFPVMTGPLSIGQMANLGLSPITLGVNTVMYNHRRILHQGGGFELDTVLTGTLVLVDRSGRIRYKADCGNRLVEQLPPAPPLVTRVEVTGGSAPITTTGISKEGFVSTWKNLGKSVKEANNKLWNGIGTGVAPFGWGLLWLIGVGLILGVITGVLALGRAGYRKISS